MGARNGVPSHRWTVVLSVLGVVLVAVFLAVAVVTVVPPAAANLTRGVADGSATELAADGRRASLVVPAGWVVVRHVDARMTTLTPDGGFRVTIELADGGAERAVQAHEKRTGSARQETLASGLTVVHAADADGGIVAAVALPSGGVVVLHGRSVGESDAAAEDAYRPSFAELLEGIRS